MPYNTVLLWSCCFSLSCWWWGFDCWIGPGGGCTVVLAVGSFILGLTVGNFWTVTNDFVVAIGFWMYSIEIVVVVYSSGRCSHNCVAPFWDRYFLQIPRLKIRKVDQMSWSGGIQQALLFHWPTQDFVVPDSFNAQIFNKTANKFYFKQQSVVFSK